jgi:FAD/FMN-containing dehydrogenase/Fe-S oxidoreductase
MSRRSEFEHLAIQLAGEIHADPLRRYLLSTDGSIFLKRPVAVIYPKNSADVARTVLFAAEQGLSLHPRGAGSGLCGASLGDGLVIDFSKFMNRLIHLNKSEEWFECEPGFRMGELEEALAGSGLFFPPDPSSGEYATFGGMTATNASGAHSVKYGNVADYLVDAQIVTADGTIQWLSEIASTPLEKLPVYLQQLAAVYQTHASDIETAYPPVKCNVAGYNLRGLVVDGRLFLHRLLCGSEGTLAIATRLRFRLLPRPKTDALVVAFFEDITAAAKAVQLVMPSNPSGIEVMDKSLLHLARESDPLLRERIPGDVDNVLLIEFDGPTAESCAAEASRTQEQISTAGLSRRHYQAVSAAEKEKFWALRKAAVPILYRLKGRCKILALVEDAAVPVDGLVPFFQGLYAIFQRHDVRFVLYGHIAKGLLHTRPLLDLKDSGDIKLLRILADAVFELVSGLDGTVSGEHGDGRLRSAYVKRRYPAIYDRFVETKNLFDPYKRLNPGIIIHDDPDQMTHDLRYGESYRDTPPADLGLLWPENFDLETEKCHGCSRCTTVGTSTRMCPVYKALRDEAAAPKAKANALRALISGALPSATLYDQAFRRVMEYCVNCGSCVSECPSNVNIPKLAMEAKAFYRRRFGLTVAARLTAEVETAGRLLRHAAPLSQALLGRPAVARICARLTGLAPERPLVTFAHRSLYQRVPRRLSGRGPQVLFYAGCYAAYIRPELGESAVRTLHRLGWSVVLPPQYCCGLPMLSKGMVAEARAKVRQNLVGWQNILSTVNHIAVTCSSCGYALQKDWAYLVGGAEQEEVQAKTIHISQLLLERIDSVKHGPPIKAAYHHPCHLRIQPQADSSRHLLDALLGTALYDLKSPCCGMAGSWGLIAENYGLSKTIGTPLAEKLNAAGAEVGVTDCPTCQMQMEHLGRLPIRHPVEIVWQRFSSTWPPTKSGQ